MGRIPAKQSTARYCLLRAQNVSADVRHEKKQQAQINAYPLHTDCISLGNFPAKESQKNHRSPANCSPSMHKNRSSIYYHARTGCCFSLSCTREPDDACAGSRISPTFLSQIILLEKVLSQVLHNPNAIVKSVAMSQFPTPALREWAANPLSPEMRETFFGPLISQVEKKSGNNKAAGGTESSLKSTLWATRSETLATDTLIGETHAI